MKLTEKAIRTGLKTKLMGKKIFCFERVTSTNDVAWQKAFEGLPEGTAIFAEEQTHGRGRFGREWFAPRGTCLLGSILLCPSIEAEKAPFMTTIAAISVVEAIEDTTALSAQIRFPNDILINSKKVAGILVESRFISSRPDFFIVGIGVNVNIPRDAFPRELRESASSLLLETGEGIDRISLAQKLLASLEHFYTLFVEGKESSLRKQWRERSFLVKKHVAILEGGKTFRGTVEDVDPLEGIILRTERGTLRHFRGERIERVNVER